MKYLIPAWFAVLIAMGIVPVASAQALKSSHEPTVKAAIKKSVPTAIVARVNGVPVTQEALDREMRRIFPYYSMHGGDVPKEYEAEIRKKALDTLIKQELAYQEAQRRKVQIPATEWQSRVREVRAGFKTQQEFETAMKKYFGSMEGFEKKLRHDVLIDRIWLLEVKNKVVVTDAAARLYYQQNKAKYTVPESIRLQTISTLFPKNATPQQKQEARKRAEVLLPKAKAAKTYEEFGVLAEKSSEDEYRVMMGDHKLVHRGALPPELEVAYSMKLGETSGIVQSPEGYHILRLNAHQQQKQLSFAEARNGIRELLEKERTTQRAKIFEQSLRKTAKVEIR